MVICFWIPWLWGTLLAFPFSNTVEIETFTGHLCLFRYLILVLPLVTNAHLLGIFWRVRTLICLLFLDGFLLGDWGWLKWLLLVNGEIILGWFLLLCLFNFTDFTRWWLLQNWFFSILFPGKLSLRHCSSNATSNLVYCKVNRFIFRLL